MPRRTSAAIEFGLIDVSAKEDSTLAVSGQLPASNVEQIEQEGLVFPKYATTELNFWLLDGKSQILPDDTADTPTGWWSEEKIGADGVFWVAPVLTVSFQNYHSSIGLTLAFYHGEWPTEINVKWYDGETLLAEKTDYPDGESYSVYNGVENYKKIVLAFRRTNHPYRYLKLTSLQYGITQTFQDDTIMEASINEGINPLSEEVSINTLHFKLHSSNAAFSILNPQGIYAFLQQKQELTVSEEVNGEKRPMGTFYLDEWNGENENTFRMDAIDAIGVMDGTQYMGGIYEGVAAGELIAAIMADAGFRYELDPRLAGEPLTGWLPISTHREALQQVAFALCAMVDTSRSDKVKIFPADDVAVGTIRRDRKFNGGTVALKQLVAGVEVSEHNYTKADTASTSTLFEGILPPGQNVITFRSPSYDLAASGATLRIAHANYAVLDVEAEQAVTVTGKNYADTTRIVGVYAPAPSAGQKQNVLTVSDATLVSRANSAQVAENIYQYHQKRIQQNFSFLLDTEETGKSYLVETLYNQSKGGMVESMGIDLTGGFIAKAALAGES